MFFATRLAAQLKASVLTRTLFTYTLFLLSLTTDTLSKHSVMPQAPAVLLQMLPLYAQSTIMSVERLALWEQLFTDITQFDDFRSLKLLGGGYGPDFSHKMTKQGLW